MKYPNLLVLAVSGLTALGATIASADTSQYSSKAALFGRRAKQPSAKVEVGTESQPVYVASSKPWLRRAQPVTGRIAEPATLAADSYNSKKAARGEREIQPVFQIAPLK